MSNTNETVSNTNETVSDTDGTVWLVMRIRHWDKYTAGVAAAGMNLIAPPYLGFGFVCAFKSQEAAEAACDYGDAVVAVRGTFPAMKGAG